MTQRYVKKPIPIEAMQWNEAEFGSDADGHKRAADAIAAWVKAGGGGACHYHAASDPLDECSGPATLAFLELETVTGTAVVAPGAFVIKGTTPGDFYPCPEHTFLETYEPVPPSEPPATSPYMGFGGALEALKHGYRVARAGWNGKGMFLFLVAGSRFQVNRAPLLGIYPEGTEINYQPHIDMRTANGTIVPWLASQSDMLAEDWYIVDGDAG